MLSAPAPAASDEKVRVGEVRAGEVRAIEVRAGEVRREPVATRSH